MSYRCSGGEDGQRDGEGRGGPRVEREEGVQQGGAMERDQGGRSRSSTVEMLAVEPPGAMENAGAARWSAVARAAVFFFLENENCMLRLGTCEREAMTN